MSVIDQDLNSDCRQSYLAASGGVLTHHIGGNDGIARRNGGFHHNHENVRTIGSGVRGVGLARRGRFYSLSYVLT